MTAITVSGNNATIATNVKTAIDAISLVSTKVIGYSMTSLGAKLYVSIMYETA